jgi:hypothetical protein
MVLDSTADERTHGYFPSTRHIEGVENAVRDVRGNGGGEKLGYTW